MARHERGILGVKRDPKKKMLFSFQVRDGEEWPSDEDDSDYNPYYNSDGEAAGTSKPKSKRKSNTQGKAKKMVKKRKIKAVDSEVGKSGTISKMSKFTDISQLPVEIWEKIFEYVIEDEGAVPFLFKIAPSICQLWSQISKKPRLWKKVDLSFGWVKMSDNTFKIFCRRQLMECRDLNFSGSKLMSKLENIQAIADNCPHLVRINLTRCNKLPQDSVNVLLKGCKLLSDIDLTTTTADSVSPLTLCNIATSCSANLKRLVFSNNPVKGFNTGISSIFDNCPNLEHLDISNIKFMSTFSIDIEKFQYSCPNLKTLGLANTTFRPTSVTQRARDLCPGFKNLEELSLAVTLDDSASAITQDVIERFLKGATKLRLLDIRGCKHVGAISCIEHIEATNLEQLFLSRSAVVSCDNLPQILNKWRHSLTDLDLSWNNFKGQILQNTINTLCSGGQQFILGNINVAGTSVSMEMVRKLLNHLPNLQSMDLTSCRDVSRGCKREYKTKKDIVSLKKFVK